MSEQIATSNKVWKRFWHNKLGLTGLGIIALFALISILGYVITPDPTPNANQMCLPLGLKRPGFTTTLIKVERPKENQNQSWLEGLIFGKEFSYKLIPVTAYKINGSNVDYQEYLGDGIAGLPASMSLTMIVRGSEAATGISQEELVKEFEKNHIETKHYWFGTDRYGRDLLSRLMLGSRITLSVGFISVAIALLVGVTLGALAGYYRGKVDDAIMWFINVVWSVPTLLLVVAITLALGKGFWQVFVAVGLTMWVDVARVVRGQFLVMRELDFINAAKVLGYSDGRIIFKHILPNVIGPIIIIAASSFASAILLEAGLSFLGIGAQPPTPSWGIMLKESYSYIVMGAGYLAILPGVCIMLLVMAFTLVGFALRDAFDTKLPVST